MTHDDRGTQGLERWERAHAPHAVKRRGKVEVTERAARLLDLRTAIERAAGEPMRLVDPVDLMTDPAWLVWSVEHGQWWRRNGAGYTPLLGDAGRFTLAEAMAAVGQRRPGALAPEDAIVPLVWS